MSAQLWTVNDDPTAAAVQTVGMLANAAIAAKGKAIVAVSGGSHSSEFARVLRNLSAEDLGMLQSHLWVVVFVDERWVPITHEDSNYKQWMDAVFSPGLLKTPHDAVLAVDTTLTDPEASARDYAARLMSLCPSISFGIPVIDIAVCGLGPDGHTASLFPGHPHVLGAAVRRLSTDREPTGTPVEIVQPVLESPKPPPKRVTLSLACLNAALSVIFLVTGASKANAVGKIAAALREVQDGGDLSPQALPGAHIWPGQLGTASNAVSSTVRAQDAPRLRWILDTAAAAEVPAAQIESV